MHRAFKVNLLNPGGIAKAGRLANLFDNTLGLLAEITGENPVIYASFQGRPFQECVKHLELASFYAKKAMAEKLENQTTAWTKDACDVTQPAGEEGVPFFLSGVTRHQLEAELKRRSM
jgi:hypothetical protein